jgi:hypothetical protein
MNNIQPTCWERFKNCWPCCRDQVVAPIQQPPAIQNVVERAIEPIRFHQVQARQHHVGKSTDMVTFQQCLQEDNEGDIHEHRRIIHDKSVHGAKKENP